jgi:hypothetical protein
MTTYSSLNAQLAGRNAQRCKLANNTYAERRGEAIAIRLHATDILTFNPDGSIVANTGGWKTLTTKDRFNQFLPVRIWQKAGRWFLGDNGKTVEFADGLTIQADGSITGAKAESSEAMKTKYFKTWKEACAYCASLDVSNECVEYNPTTNLYLVVLDANGKVVNQ